MMLRNDFVVGDSTYGGTAKIKTTSKMTQGSSIQWNGGGGGAGAGGGSSNSSAGKTAENDMQRNHMLDAIAVGVVLFGV